MLALRRLFATVLSFGWPRDAFADCWPVGRPEPWRERQPRPDIILMSRTGLLAVADPVKLQEVQRNDRSWIDEIRADVDFNGFRLWLEVVIDDHGRLVLRDGYHRLVAAGELDIRLLPVTFTESASIRGYKQHIRAVIATIAGE